MAKKQFTKRKNKKRVNMSKRWLLMKGGVNPSLGETDSEEKPKEETSMLPDLSSMNPFASEQSKGIPTGPSTEANNTINSAMGSESAPMSFSTDAMNSTPMTSAPMSDMNSTPVGSMGSSPTMSSAPTVGSEMNSTPMTSAPMSDMNSTPMTSAPPVGSEMDSAPMTSSPMSEMNSTPMFSEQPMSSAPMTSEMNSTPMSSAPLMSSMASAQPMSSMASAPPMSDGMNLSQPEPFPSISDSLNRMNSADNSTSASREPFPSLDDSYQNSEKMDSEPIDTETMDTEEPIESTAMDLEDTEYDSGEDLENETPVVVPTNDDDDDNDDDEDDELDKYIYKTSKIFKFSNPSHKKNYKGVIRFSETIVNTAFSQIGNTLANFVGKLGTDNDILRDLHKKVFKRLKKICQKKVGSIYDLDISIKYHPKTNAISAVVTGSAYD